MLTDLLYRLRAIFRRNTVERELNEELQLHLEYEANKLMRMGLDRTEAVRRARIALGGTEQVREECREARGISVWDTTPQDIRYGWRQFQANPVFTFAVVLTLAVGIGANTAVFSVVKGILLRSLPYQDPGRLVMMWTDDPAHNVHEEGISYPNFVDWRTANRAFEDLAICSRSSPATLTGGELPQRVESAVVSENLFTVLGVQPELGRTFSPDEVSHGDRAVIISHSLWQTHFGAAPDSIGKSVEIDGVNWRIVGVMPASFQFPTSETQFWQQLASFPRWKSIRGERYSDWGRVVGRLKPNITLAQAQTEMNAIGKRLQQQYPPTRADDFAGFKVNLVPLAIQVTGKELPLTLWVLFGAVWFVLSIACVNVASMLLARGAAREREFILRSALGAGRQRIVKQLLTESLMLALIAGAVALGVARFALPGLLALAPANLPRMSEVSIDSGVLLFCLSISVFAGVLFGLAPAVRLSNSSATLNCRSTHTTRQSARRGNILVVGQFALSSVLLCSAGLLIRSFLTVETIQPGFHPEHVLTVRIAAPGSDSAAVPFYDQVLNRVESLPDVVASGLIEDVLQRRNPDYQIVAVGRSEVPSEPVSGDAISPACFHVLGVQLLRGRIFTGDDRGGPPVAVINETMARHFWPNEDPIGRQFREAGALPKQPPYTVVGVISDMRRQGLEREPIAQIFWPYFQRVSSTSDLIIRTSSDPAQLANAVRAEIRSINKTAPVFNVSTLDRRLDASLAPRRFQSVLMALFAAVALGLSAIGVYGLMHYSVAQRTHEIGIRMALGARAAEVMRMIVRQGMVLALLGLAMGAVGSLFVTRLLSGLLFGVTPSDPLTFILAGIAIVAVAVLACYIPARRAARIDPLVALRSE
ncbi:MAG TPA: ABC transporter permease [Bryobacteraceae bacterium]|nr:ABC transporter permease [Bryobacteraceae bacterium]